MAGMKLVFVYGNRISSRLTKLFTGSTAYHIGFTDGNKFWDMHFIRRRRLWPLYPPARIIVIDCPANITADYLDYKLDTCEEWYGIWDYLLFGLRPLYHLFGKSTRNASGVICSEMVALDLAACGWQHQFASVPSPADLEQALLGRVDAIHKN